MICNSIRTRAPVGGALVTGASSGIGAAFARHLARERDVLLVARSESGLAAVAESIRSNGPGGRRVEVLAADLTAELGLSATVEAAGRFGAGLLVNNAGSGTLAPVVETDPQALRATVRLNVEAPLWLSRALVPGLIEVARSGGGRAGLINVSSSAAFLPVPGFATYAASKAFVLSLTEALAVELRDEPIDVLALCPGATKSDFGARAGYRGGQLPGAVEPERVVVAAMRALGRRTTLLTGPEAAAFAPVALGRSRLGDLVGRISGRLRDAVGG